MRNAITRATGTAVLVMLVLAAAAQAQTVKCPATRDVWLSAMGEEADFNMGAAKTMKLKVWQEFALADFDVSGVKGKTVKEAYLYVKPVGGQKFGLNNGTDLRWLTVSTVGCDWVEGQSSTYAADAQGHGATFNESSYQTRNWGWQGAKAWDVILGHGNTLRFDGQLEPAGKWLRVKLDPRLVGALAAGATHGLLLMDGSTSVGVNCTIASRESGEGPYLEVVTGGADSAAPPAPGNLSVAPAPNWATPDLGAIEVSLTVPADAFAYHVKFNGQAVPRWMIPFAETPGTVQKFVIVDLPPGAEAAMEVSAVDTAGNVSPAASAKGKVSPKLTVPQLPDSPFAPRPGEPKALGKAKVWAFPEVTKVDPVDGKVLQEKVAGDIRRANPVWDGSTGTVRLAAARGEIVSFQLAVEGQAAGVSVTVSDLAGAGKIPAGSVRLWRNWYVGRNAEYAIPLKGTFDCPSADNSIAGQTLQAVTVDLLVPSDTRPGEYAGTVTVACGDDKVALPLKVKVYDVVIPDDIHFNPELNCYNGPGQAGSDKFKDSFRLAHYHRATINRVPYSQGGNVHADWAPKVDAAGHVTDWSEFDANLGGLLDGSWFATNPRASVPVPTLYLPLFEGWPLDFRKHYNPGQGVPVNGKDDDEKLKHDTLARPIEQAVDKAFQDAFVTCTRDFVKHFRDKGWNRTVVECYLNNKPNYGYTLWTLDEPFEYLDWAALNFLGRLYKQGVDDPEVYAPAWHEEYFRKGLAGMKRSRPTFLYRGDISRLMWQGSVSDGLMNIIYLGGGGLGTPRMVRFAKDRMPSIMCGYGSCNDVSRSNWESAAWCLRAYANDCDGVLPWQSLEGAQALRTPTQTGLIIDTGRYGQAVASFRVHALRRGAQDCELLRLLQLKNDWSRGHIGLLVAQKVPLTAQYKQAFEDQAAAMTFGTLTAQGFCQMKEGVLQLLEKR